MGAFGLGKQNPAEDQFTENRHKVFFLLIIFWYQNI